MERREVVPRRKYDDLFPGAVLGNLTLISRMKSGRRVHWNCLCLCGNQCSPSHDNLIAGTSSCGCLRVGRIAVHGHARRGSRSSENIIWNGMKDRCRNKNSPIYKYYGGRGIKVCERWMNFENFLADMGPRPSKEYSIERNDPNGDYCPENCRWATDAEQANNRRTSRRITVSGETKTIAEWSRESGVRQSVIGFRILSGWTPYKAIFTPPTVGPRKGQLFT